MVEDYCARDTVLYRGRPHLLTNVTSSNVFTYEHVNQLDDMATTYLY